jgi:RNA polymerase sigma factor (TIGR02999 family)
MPAVFLTMPQSPESVTELLQVLRDGDQTAFNALLPLVYDELHRLAGQQRNRWDGDETLDTTALVHEAYFRLADQSAPNWQNKAHFLSVAATAMRQILIDYSKRKRAAKRGGKAPHLSLHDLEPALLQSATAAGVRDDIMVALDESLGRLEQVNRRQMRIVECRFFGGMSVEDTAEALGVSPATVKRGWRMAQAWLYRDLTDAAGAAP